MGRIGKIEMPCAFEDCFVRFVTTDNRKMYCSRKCAYTQCSRNYYRERVEAMRERAKKYRKDNPDIIYAQNQKIYWSDPDKHRDRVLVWAKNNPHAVSHIGRRRRARQNSALSTLTKQEWESILRQFKGRCAYCKKKKVLTMDHVIPLAKGGNHTKDNVLPACSSCNSKKGNRDLSVFLSRLS